MARGWEGKEERKAGDPDNLGKSKQDSVRINYPTASPNLRLTGGGGGVIGEVFHVIL